MAPIYQEDPRTRLGERQRERDTFRARLRRRPPEPEAHSLLLQLAWLPKRD